jgi:hypothetical protein
VHEWPSYLAHATSCWTIGGLWFIHHGIVRWLDVANIGVLRLNLLAAVLGPVIPLRHARWRRTG